MKTLLVFVCWLGFVPVMTVADASAPDVPAALQDWLGSQPGGVAAAVVDVHGTQFFNVGKFAADDPRPITADTEFEIGSITKVFTALLLADAVQRGAVTLDEPVGPPFAARSITYLQLATHTSGLPRLPADMTVADYRNPYAGCDLPALLKSFADAARRAKPGPPDYSNFGFAVLGQAVAAADGGTYAVELRQRVLAPLSLTDTCLSWREADPKRLATGHDDSGAPASNWDLDAFAPAGALVSTTRDLAKFAQACLGLAPGRPLAEPIALTLVSRAGGEAGAAGEVGLAWQITRKDGRTVYWHNGGTGGYRSFLAFEPAARRGIVLLTNHTRGLEATGFALLAGRQPVPTTPVETPSGEPAAATLQPYLGNYPLAPSFVIAITAAGEELFLQATGQPRFKLNTLAPDRYAVEGVPAEISFERDSTGKVSALVLHQNGRDQRAPHLAPGEKPKVRTEVRLPPETLEDYVGRYRLGGMDFVFTRRGDQLWGQLTGQPAIPLFASAKDDFFYKVVDAQVSFQRGADGKVEALVLHQNGRDLRAPRE